MKVAPGRLFLVPRRGRFGRFRALPLAAVLLLVGVWGCAAPVLRVVAGPAGPEQLVNPGFAASGKEFPGWEPWTDGFAVGPGRSGSTSVHCANPEPRQRGIGQRVDLDQTIPAPVLVQGWSRAEKVSGGRDTEYSLYVDLTYQDGEEAWGLHAPFDPGTHDWQEQRLLVRPPKPIRELRVYGLFRGHLGEAWFDDFSVAPMTGAALFDGQPVSAGRAGTAEGGPLYTTEDGLVLGYDPRSGAVTRVWTGDRELTASGRSAGFLVRDAAAGSDYFGFTDGICGPLSLKLEVQVEARADHLRFTGRLTNLAIPTAADTATGAADRAVTLVFSLPLDAVGWQWHRGLRGGERIQTGREYADLVAIGTGATGEMSRYLWAAIGDAESELVLGVDPGLPVQHRLGYSSGTGLFYVAMDLGLAPEPLAFPNSAPFSLVLARAEPEGGFRSAAAAWYRIFPEAFACRSPRQGIWMPFTDVSTVAGWQDFGFGYHEGNNNLAFDDQAGILSFRYTEPSTWWMPMPAEAPRTDEGVMEVLRQRVEAGDRRAQAVEVSGSHDAAGRLQYQIRREPWCDGAVFSSNPSPGLPGPSEAAMNWSPEVRERLYGSSADGEQDGEYLDSVEGYVTATENWRRDHFVHARAPLTFSTSARRPVIHKAWSTWEFADHLARELRGMGKLLFGNSLPERYAFLAPCFDVMGTETNWLRAGALVPPADDWFALKRYMAYHKPYLLLMNTDYDRLTPDLVDRYLQHCLFYGFYPSMFSHNAAENPYWETPLWYERDRNLFRRYIPLIQRVAEAGWEPLTGARAEEPRVWLERFGPDPTGRAWITVLNTGELPVRTRVILDPAVFGVAPGVTVILDPRGLTRDDEGLILSLESGQVQVLELVR